MRFLTVKRDGVALYSFCAEHRCQRQAHAFEDRALLDVQLDVRSRVFLLKRRFAESIDFDSATPQSIFEPDAIAIGTHAVSRDAGGACER
jgi:hypothetical protein